MNLLMAEVENKLILYQDENGITNVSVRFADQDLWLTQEQLAEIYDTTQQNISGHLMNIYNDGELDREATHKKFLLVRQEGTRLRRTISRRLNFSGSIFSFRNSWITQSSRPSSKIR